MAVADNAVAVHNSAPGVTRGATPAPAPTRESALQRAVTVLEFVAAQGGAGARDIAVGTGLPLPTVYRIARELCDVEYLVHLRTEQRFALGYKLHRLAVGLHEDLAVPSAVRREIASLHRSTGMAAYLAIHRGADFVVVFVADSPDCPRLQPMEFGFHDHPHATAFGKLGLSELSSSQREDVLREQGMRSLTASTINDRVVLESELGEITGRGVAWEHEEFQVGTTCAAVPVRAEDGMLIGSVAVSAPVHRYAGQRTHVEHLLRACASRAGRAYRLGPRRGYTG